jgi:hypothetical protein
MDLSSEMQTDNAERSEAVMHAFHFNQKRVKPQGNYLIQDFRNFRFFDN